MAKFIIEKTDAEKRRNKKMFLIYIILGVLCIVLYFSSETDRFLPVWMFFVTMSGAVSAYRSFKNIGKVKFAEINANNIEWSIQDTNDTHVFFDWSDVRWIKKENTGISFYMDSSFCHNLRDVEFSRQDHEKLLEVVVDYAHQHSVRLVNFSEEVLAMA